MSICLFVYPSLWRPEQTHSLYLFEFFSLSVEVAVAAVIVVAAFDSESVTGQFWWEKN